MFITFKRILRSAWQGLFRDGGMVLMAVFTIFATTLLVSSLFLLQDVNRFLISSLQEKVDFSVYFKDEALEDDILAMKDMISDLPEVKEVNYVSKDQALAEFTKRHEDDQVLMDAVKEVGGNPFLSSLTIKSLAASQYQALADFLAKPDFQDLVEKVDYQERKPVINRLFSVTSLVGRGGLILSIILTLAAFLVTFNTIRLAIYNFREEIKVQRLVGASNWFIRGPFLVQGVLTGLAAALAAFLALILISLIFNSSLKVIFSGLNLFSIFLSNFWPVLSVQLLAGVGLGVVSAYLSVRKYLKV